MPPEFDEEEEEAVGTWAATEEEPWAEQIHRQVGTPLQEGPLPARLPLSPTRSEYKPQPVLTDAIACWNELVQAGEHPSRNHLQQALIAKGFA